MLGRRRQPKWSVMLLAGLASLGFAVVSMDGTDRWEIAFRTLVPLMFAIAAGRLLFARYGAQDHPPTWLPLAILMIGIGAFAEEFLRRQFWANGRALELVMLCGLRNVMLSAAAASLWRNMERVAAMLSLFLVLFAAIAGDDSFLYVVLLVYTVLGTWWLMSNHWSQLSGRLPDEESSMKRPVAVWVLLPILLATLIAMIPLSGGSAADALSGFMPSSGGQGQFDPYARRGVGDGDMLVAGTKNVQSFAPIDDAPFLDSDKPSLYDVFNETYDEPVPPKNQDRAIALPPELMQEATQRMAESQFASRQFSTLRQAPKPRAAGLTDRTSEALFSWPAACRCICGWKPTMFSMALNGIRKPIQTGKTDHDPRD